MRDLRYNFYILNLFTHEMIDLPDVDRKSSDGVNIRSPVLWIDEKTKDYVVSWGFARSCVVYSKKGDNLWKQIPKTSHCIDLVYKDHKLYFLSYSGRVKIFDFSGEIPRETFECSVILSGMELPRRCRRLPNSWCVSETKLVVTVTGDILKVEKWFRPRSGIWSFRLYKFYSSGFYKKPEQLDSLGDEAMLFDKRHPCACQWLGGSREKCHLFH
ncbi:unnamed protein product [Arabis nemorensis]|uniref:KIB1-4 beta-propeller domain-containing protein n=1 Tax=Arabis nemorensis TaxID=586526 RepID=A0A565CEV0_9BRAS|nr:unnamed protein product [Arabis nemorensis]